jgi:hypothetical protein
MSLLDHIANEPLWLQAWINWMVLVNVGGLLFAWSRVEPRWVVLAFLGSAITMNYLFGLYGYEKILGLAHVIFWTPLLIYLYRRRSEIGRRGASAIYLQILFVTNFVSLLMDYYDVASYLIVGRA